MEKVHVFVRDLEVPCRGRTNSETYQECGRTASNLTLARDRKIYTCALHVPELTLPEQTHTTIELEAPEHVQEAITSFERRLEWVIEDIGSSAQKVAERLLKVLPRLRLTDPRTALELLQAFSFAWDSTTDKYIEESLREQEVEDFDLGSD